jgi:arginine exporter protein ArgO
VISLLKTFLNGLTTGLILQVAIGPVFFFLANIALQRNIVEGLAAALVVTFVDYIYIALAIAGTGKLLEKVKIKRLLSYGSPIALIIFGLLMAKNTINVNNVSLINQEIPSLLSTLIAVFFLTLSSPLTIVFWTSIFAARAIEYSLTKKELIIFGISAGLATLIFLGLSIILISLIKTTIPTSIIPIVNMMVALVLLYYGISRLFKLNKRQTQG